MSTLQEIAKKIEDSASFVIHCHTSPDPDTIGSVLGLKIALESIGKIVHAYCEDEIIHVARFLPEVDNIAKMSMREALTFKHDSYLSLDTAKWELCTHGSNRPQDNIINIDHHPDNQIKAKLSLIDPESASTAQIILRLIQELNIEITEDIATCLLFGLLGDTSVFQNTNTNTKCFDDAQFLTHHGARYHECVLHLTRSYIAEDMRSWGVLLQNIKLSEDRRYAWMTLDHESYQSLEGDTKIGVMANNFAGRVNGTLFGAVIIEKDKGVTKGSLRSRIPDFDVSQIAHLLGGGGHPASSSFMIEEPLEQAEQKFLKAVKSVLDQHDKKSNQ
jgi:bifunctional oligoribonuclease and PAP phosphatase NrnA